MSVQGPAQEDNVKVKGFSHVAIRVSDLSRSARFYEDLLDLKRIIDLPDVIVLLHAGGTMLGIRGATSDATTSERKTRVKHAEVITARLVRDERGWLRLAG